MLLVIDPAVRPVLAAKAVLQGMAAIGEKAPDFGLDPGEIIGMNPLSSKVGIFQIFPRVVAKYSMNLSRRSRNQKSVRRLSNNHPRLSRAILDDPPIHIAQIVPANAGASVRNPLGSSHYGRTIVPKNISAATPICAKNVTSQSVRD